MPRPVFAKLVFGRRIEELEIVFQNVLDAKEDIAKSRLRASAGASVSPCIAIAEVMACTVYAMSFRPASMMALA